MTEVSLMPEPPPPTRHNLTALALYLEDQVARHASLRGERAAAPAIARARPGREAEFEAKLASLDATLQVFEDRIASVARELIQGVEERARSATSGQTDGR